jgi:hypothetical protein
MPFGGLLTLGVIGAGGSIIGAGIGANAASTAANEQAQAAANALAFQERVWESQQQNSAPFIQAGQYGVGQLMQGLQNGTFGPGSIPQFTAPTAEQARMTPGYQFTQDQGIQAIQRSAAARGGLGSGSTLKALESFGTGLADTTYNDVFSRAMSGYNANLTRQSQAYNQLAGIAGTGQTATANLNNTGTNTAFNVGNLMTGIGNAQAAGTIGVANAVNQGIGGVTNNLALPLLLPQLLNPGGGGFTAAGGSNPNPNIGLGPANPLPLLADTPG